MFPQSEITQRFAVVADGTLAGFTVLTDIASGEAEFYIAVHPKLTGQGIGRIALQQTLRVAFHELHLSRIYLKVRSWHRRGITLYRSEGFESIGQKEELVQGHLVGFDIMEIRFAETDPP
jgi:diamine N-acetyltransferase